jgi:hypothetical protein
MMRALSTWSRPPRTLRRQRLQEDNAVLLPASELGSIKLWQHRAQQLAPGTTLLVLSVNNPRLHSLAKQFAHIWREQSRLSQICSIRRVGKKSAPPK